MTKFEHLPAWSRLTPGRISALLERPGGSMPDAIRVAADLDHRIVPEIAFLGSLFSRPRA